MQAVRDDIANKELEKEELAIAAEWLAEVNNFSAATPASDVAAAVAEVYTTFFNSDTIKTDVAREAVREKALELQAIIADATQEFMGLKDAYDAAKKASEAEHEKEELKTALDEAEKAFNEAVANYGYIFEDESGNKTLVVSVASWGGNAAWFIVNNTYKTLFGVNSAIVSNVKA